MKNEVMSMPESLEVAFERATDETLHDDRFDALREASCENKIGYTALCASCPLALLPGNCLKIIRERVEDDVTYGVEVLGGEALDVGMLPVTFDWGLEDSLHDEPFSAELQDEATLLSDSTPRAPIVESPTEAVVEIREVPLVRRETKPQVERDVEKNDSPRRSYLELLLDDDVPAVFALPPRPAPVQVKSTPHKATVEVVQPQARKPVMRDAAPAEILADVPPIEEVSFEVSVEAPPRAIALSVTSAEMDGTVEPQGELEVGSPAELSLARRTPVFVSVESTPNCKTEQPVKGSVSKALEMIARSEISHSEVAPNLVVLSESIEPIVEPSIETDSLHDDAEVVFVARPVRHPVVKAADDAVSTEYPTIARVNLGQPVALFGASALPEGYSAPPDIPQENDLQENVLKEEHQELLPFAVCDEQEDLSIDGVVSLDEVQYLHDTQEVLHNNIAGCVAAPGVPMLTALLGSFALIQLVALAHC